MSGVVRSGSITLDEVPVDSSFSAFVHQFIELHPGMTVLETLRRTALLFYPNLSVSLRDSLFTPAQLIDELIAVLDLQASESVLVGKLSVATTKRLAIACSLLTSPRILCLDEITTSLDASSAYQILVYLKKIVVHFDLVCFVAIHQPSELHLQVFDDLLLLARGKSFYNGPIACLPQSDVAQRCQNSHSGKVELLESIMELLKSKEFNTNEITVQLDSYSSNPLRERETLLSPGSSSGTSQPLEMNQTSSAHRFSVLVKYFDLMKFRTPGMYSTRLILTIFCALFCGFLYLRLTPSIQNLRRFVGAIFMISSASITIGVSPCSSFHQFKTLFHSEYRKKTYSLSSYFLSFFLASLRLNFLLSIIFNLLVWFLIGLNDEFGAFVYSCLMTITILTFSDSLNLLANEITPNPSIALIFSLSYVSFAIVFSTIFLPREKSPASINWVPYIYPIQYMLRGHSINAFQNRKIFDSLSGVYIDGGDILEKYLSIDRNESKWMHLGILLLFSFGFRLIQSLIIMKRYRQ